MNKGLVAGVSLSVLLGGAWLAGSSAIPKDTSCVTVYVDYGVLSDSAPTTQCIGTEKKINALDVLEKAGVSVEGTGKYGSQVACRVNGLPSATKPIGIEGHEDYTESCAEMPAEFAYWAVLIKRHAPSANPLEVNWGWAQTGIDQVVLEPGDSVGLVFADNENVEFPK